MNTYPYDQWRFYTALEAWMHVDAPLLSIIERVEEVPYTKGNLDVTAYPEIQWKVFTLP
jgi:hypothetical protein